MDNNKDGNLVVDGLFGFGLSGFGMADNGMASPRMVMGTLLLVWILGTDELPQPRNERGVWAADGIWQDTAVWYY